MLDEASLMPAESGTAAALSVPETGYLFEGQLSQVTCLPCFSLECICVSLRGSEIFIGVQGTVCLCVPAADRL